MSARDLAAANAALARLIDAHGLDPAAITRGERAAEARIYNPPADPLAALAYKFGYIAGTTITRGRYHG